MKVAEELYSRHIFIFPFIWNCFNTHKNIEDVDFTSRKTFKTIETILNNNVFLEPNSFSFETIVDRKADEKGEKSYFNTYNEKKYFYEFAHSALNLTSDKKAIDTVQYKAILSDDAYYSISLKNPETTFTLGLKDVHVNFYTSGVGVVTFFLENDFKYKYDEILTINDYARRIYPQFLGNSPGAFTSETKYSFLAERLEVKFNQGNGNTVVEDFSHYNDFSCIIENDSVLPAHVSKLLGYNFVTKIPDKPGKGQILIRPVIDDRMYTMCFIRDETVFNELRIWNTQENTYEYNQSSKWYRLLFVDNSKPLCTSKIMLANLNSISTYDRWIDGQDNDNNPTGHLFGITRYSFITLAHPGWFTDNLLHHHFTRIYYQMVLLATIQRGSILSFSAELKRISYKIKDEDINTKDVERISDLHKNYTIFLNRIFFRSVTAQEQGIELYEMIMKNMQIKEEAENLKAEIESLNEFVRNKEAHKLSWVASLYLPAALVASIICWFAPDIKTYNFRYLDIDELVAMFLLVLCVVFLLLFHKKINKTILWLTNKF